MPRFLSGLLAFILATAAFADAYADDYPSRSVRLVVGFGPGGATDTFGRLFAATLSQRMGQTVFVENVSGASGYIAWQRVASSAPDGYTLMMAENALVMRPGFKDIEPQFDPVTQFTPVAFAGTSPLAADLGTHRDAPFLDVDENFTAHSSLLHAPVNAVVAPAAMSTRCRTAEASGGKGELR